MFDAKIYNGLRIKYSHLPNEKNLQKVREYLDSVGYKMPKPRYIYNEADKGTWRFLNGKADKKVTKKEKTYVYVPIINLKFQYADYAKWEINSEGIIREKKT